jgi:hypothetical protein
MHGMVKPPPLEKEHCNADKKKCLERDRSSGCGWRSLWITSAVTAGNSFQLLSSGTFPITVRRIPASFAD